MVRTSAGKRLYYVFSDSRQAPELMLSLLLMWLEVLQTEYGVIGN
jgi:hypothetical protein